MEKFTQKIVQMMKEEKLFQSQGGPIILSQVNLMSTILRFRFEFHKLNMKKKKKIKFVDRE